MNSIIEIENILNAIPKKGVWYCHYGTIFISVMRKSQPYVRRKSIPEDKKVDRDMCEWHRHWQYEKIESNYGIHISGKKTYEISIEVDNEKHRIDSVVGDIAIEFQHTLSVPVEEMNARFKAHSKFGFIPYLVIDLTMHDSIHDASDSKIEKWCQSEYGRNNKLFLDYKDHMMRFSNVHEEMFLTHSKVHFLEHLTELENEYEKSCSIEKQRLKKEEEKRKIREEENLEKLAYYELEEYKTKRNKSGEFEYFRRCFKNPLLKSTLLPYLDKIFSFEYENAFIDRNTYIKIFSYYSTDFQRSIKYMLVIDVKMDYYHKFGKQYFGEVRKFSHAAIELSGFEEKDRFYEIKYGKTQEVGWVNFNIIPYEDL